MEQQDNNKQENNGPKLGQYWIYGLIAVVFLGFNLITYMGSTTKELQKVQLEKMLKAGDVEKVELVQMGDAKANVARITIRRDSLKKPAYAEIALTKFKQTNPGPHYSFKIGDPGYFMTYLDKVQEELKATPSKQFTYNTITENNYLYPILSTLLPIALLVGIWIFVMRRMGGGPGGPGGQLFNIGKSRATLFEKDSKVPLTFQDVAGLDEAKEEVMEVVDFLKNPKKYTALGGKIPKGVLLVGPPGTGKTLLAKAVAGEASVPFFSISGSDFVEMFVGVGASRVRDLFKQAKEKAPCIIFMDEIDAVGRARGGRNIQGGNDERENTLNQLLVEMDGFGTDKGIIIIAATNRPDVLDPALLRPGRFDRQISIDKPDLVGREQIFAVHLKPIKIDASVTAKELAHMTPGFAGAEIANICNEAALIAARKNKDHVDLSDFNAAVDRVIGGLEKKNKIIRPDEKRIIAYHEAGHAICGWYLQHASPLVKVTIVPRGVAALGYAQYLPKENYINTTEQMNDMMCMTLGGRAAEANIFNRISTGAQSDLDQVTKMAYAMITVYGMNEKVGNVSFYDMQQNQFERPYSDETAQLIDSEARNQIETQYQRAKALLKEHERELELLANELLNKEVLSNADLERLIGKRHWEDNGDEHVHGQPLSETDAEPVN